MMVRHKNLAIRSSPRWLRYTVKELARKQHSTHTHTEHHLVKRRRYTILREPVVKSTNWIIIVLFQLEVMMSACWASLLPLDERR